jgi:hypothetical protein
VIVASVGLLILQVALPQSAAKATGALPVQMGYKVSPDTVLIGQQFDLFVKVLAPKGVRFEFPAGPDTTRRNGVQPIELRDTAVALYRLVAWDIGIQPLRISDVTATLGAEQRRLPLGGASVFVKSVLPADTTLRVPKPPRPLIVLPVFNWSLWLALLAAAIAAALLWWAWRRYRNRPRAAVDPYVRAQQEFARVEQLRLLENGRAGEYVALMADIAREYLASRVSGVRRSDTTMELLRTMQPRDGVEAELPGLFELADLVKFARAQVSRDDAARAGSSIRAIVEHVEARVNPASDPAKKAAAAKARAA